MPVSDPETRVRVIFGVMDTDIPGLLPLSNGDGLTVGLDVVDVQGNRFTGELRLMMN
ncbi:hypothetical protein NKDENANG_00546 [Candidatus Entotheonellaceae bacterium PAL068K]